MKFDALVIGKGPAGISAAVYLLRAGFSVGILATDYGALERTDKIENFYGFPEAISGKELALRGEAQAKRLGARIFDGEVVGVAFDGTFSVRTAAESFSADALVFAAGTSRKKPKVKDLDKFEGSGVSYCAVCDAFFFRGRKVAVLGSGEYAKNEVEELKSLASVTVLTDGEEPTADFDVPVERKKVASLFGDFALEGVEYADGSRENFDGIFIAIGRASTADLVKKLGAVVQNGEVEVDGDFATTVPGVYAAGDCVPGVKQVAKAVCDGMTAAMSAIKFLRAKKTK
ncbi:MAG: NAD(P)/FAD-dependent oxidoreductase [Clostridia bacterium]|nr:NAD(P)/FAD-dependent oxidoreductase [Clostridia bacterium]